MVRVLMAARTCALLRPPQFAPEVTECGHILGIAGDIAWSGELRGDPGAGGDAVAGLGGDSFAAKEKAVIALGKSGDPHAVAILQSLNSDRLRKTPDGRVVIVEGIGTNAKITDAVTVLTEPCPCGSAHRCVADIQGRLDDVFEYDGRRVHPLVFRSPLGRRSAATSQAGPAARPA